MVRVGVIGYGYWGPNLVRNFMESEKTSVVAVADQRPERLALVTSRYPTVRVMQDASELIRDTEVDAVIIATPVSSHFPLALQALQAGKHVLVEKPMASSVEEAARLVDEAATRGLVLAVDHTFIYSGPVRKMHQLISEGQLGRIHYYDSVRINLGLFQHDVNVLWDLAVHDLTIMDYVLPSQPVAVSATGARHVAGQPENIAYLTLFHPDNLLAHVHVNWLSPVKLRQTLVAGSDRMIVYNDMEVATPIRVYDSGINLAEDDESIHRMLISYRTGDMWAPRVDPSEALKVEVNHFAECVAGNGKPIADGEAGLRTVAALEAAAKSLADRGQPVRMEMAVGAG
jgi:predicted dehydrogenase